MLAQILRALSTASANNGPVALTAREALSGIFGSISLTFWIFLMIPQLVENYQQQSSEAVSLAMLLLWLAGDASSLVGALFANLVPIILTIVVYFFLSDFVLLGQYAYYKVKNAHKASALRRRGVSSSVSAPASHERRHEDGPPTDSRTPLLHEATQNSMGENQTANDRETRDPMVDVLRNNEPKSVWASNTLAVLAVCLVGTMGWVIAYENGLWTPAPLDSDLPEPDKAGISAVAEFSGYLSAVFYLGARIPQIIKNHRDKSCEGLSILFFIMSVAGNVTYGGGILFHSTDKDYVIANMPWLLGAFGTIAEDATIFAQFKMYSRDRSDENVNPAV